MTQNIAMETNPSNNEPDRFLITSKLSQPLVKSSIPIDHMIFLVSNRGEVWGDELQICSDHSRI